VPLLTCRRVDKDGPLPYAAGRKRGGAANRRVQDVTLREIPLLVFDGACGTGIQSMALPDSVWQGKEGCNELLNVTAPEAIAGLHEGFLAAGATVVETNTFGASRIVLAEYGLEGRVAEINAAAVANARRAIGGLGVPLSIAGTRACTSQGPSLASSNPVKSVTIERTGTMLLGSDIAAVVATLEPFPLFSLGLNCATGPADMTSHIRYLSRYWPGRISCIPNAGLPEVVGGCTVYPLGPRDFARQMAGFVRDYGVSVVGGCCGTTPEHIRELIAALAGVTPVRQAVEDEPLSAAGVAGA